MWDTRLAIYGNSGFGQHNNGGLWHSQLAGYAPHISPTVWWGMDGPYTYGVGAAFTWSDDTGWMAFRLWHTLFTPGALPVVGAEGLLRLWRLVPGSRMGGPLGRSRGG